MYTIIWKEFKNGKTENHWERFENKDDTKRFLNTLKTECNILETDTWIFTPDAELFTESIHTFS